MLRILAVGLALAASVGCKVNSSGGETKSQSEFYSYDFTENGCHTGTHTSNSVPGICTKLEDHTLNRNCAYGMRAAKFRDYNCFVVLGNKPAATDFGHQYQQDERAKGKPDYFSYDITVNGCATGAHEFFSKKELCAGLMDTVKNNDCALKERQDLFLLHGCE